MSLQESKSEHAGLIIQIQYSASGLIGIKSSSRHTTAKLNLAPNLWEELHIISRLLLQMNTEYIYIYIKEYKE